jgi:hypothetical protein
MTITVHHFELDRKHFDVIPERERNLFFLLAHAANELNILAKLLHFSLVDRNYEQIVLYAQNAQMVLLLRMLAAKIFETWALLKKGYFDTSLSREYRDLLDQETRDTLRTLKRYFGTGNVIERIRNRFAFHYDLDDVAVGYRTIEGSEPFDMYVSPMQVNSLFAFADSIANRAMLEAVCPGKPKEAIDVLFRETNVANGRMVSVITSLIKVCFGRHIEKSYYELPFRTYEMTNAPSAQEVGIPFFIEISGKGAQKD